MQRRLTTILAADISGFSRLVGINEEETLAALRAHRSELIDPLLSKFGGRLANTAGDSLLVEFPSAVEAVRWALAVQEGMTARNAAVPEDRRIAFRMGINVGDVIAVEDGDLLGDGVNIAARLETLAPPGGIILSRTARDQVRDRLSLALADLGEIDVKNIARPVRSFQILREGEKAIRRPRRVGRGAVALLAASLVLLAVLGGGLYWHLRSMSLPSETKSAGPALPDKPSIAVLPFTNLSDDANQEYFADGLTDDLIIDLSKLSGLFVISRNSVFTFKGKPVRIDEVAEELGVHYVIEGSVRRSGDRLRVNAQLIEGRTGRHLWAERYDRQTADLFAVQDDLVGRIVSALAVQLTQSEESQLAQQSVPKFEAYDLYLRARDGHFSRDQTRMEESLRLYKEAWAVDPEFARAYAGYARLAADIWRLFAVRGLSGAAMRRAAETAANKALSLDPTLADSYLVLAVLSTTVKEHDKALEFVNRAIQLDPNGVDAHMTAANVLIYAGKIEEALKEAEIAIRLNPRPSIYHLVYYGLALFMNQRYDDAIAALAPASIVYERAHNESPREILAMAYAKSGRLAEARAAIEDLKIEAPYLNLAWYRFIYDHHARKEDLERRIDALRDIGLPDWPFGFEGDPDQQLAGPAIEDLIASTTWSGQDLGRQLPFIQEFGPGGSSVMAAQNTLLNGSAFVRDDELCERYEGFLLGREFCGPIFRNPAGSAEEQNEYVQVTPFLVRYFTVAN